MAGFSFEALLWVVKKHTDRQQTNTNGESEYRDPSYYLGGHISIMLTFSLNLIIIVISKISNSGLDIV